MAFDWKKLLGGVAPMAATALGGPLAGAAAGALVKALGMDGKVDPKDTKAVEEMLSEAVLKPEQIIQLRQAEMEFKKAMAELDIKSTADLERIAADDRKDARNRQIQMRDRMPAVLSVTITIGFFGLLFYLLKWAPPAESRDILNIMLGSLGTAWIGAMQFYFGSTSGSARKDMLLHKSTPVD